MDNTGTFVLIATNLLSLFFLLLKFRGKPEPREITPQPLQVKEHVDPLSRAEHERLCAERKTETARIHAKMDKLSEEFKAGLERLSADASRRSASLFARIENTFNPLVIKVSKLEGQVENHIENHPVTIQEHRK